MKKAYAVVEVPDETKTAKEADDYIWEKMKRAIEMQMLELLPRVEVYKLGK